MNHSLGQEPREEKELLPSWPVSYREKGEISGLSEGIKDKDVLLFQGSDDKWYAQNSSLKLLEEMQTWRSDWQEEE